MGSWKYYLNSDNSQERKENTTCPEAAKKIKLARNLNDKCDIVVEFWLANRGSYVSFIKEQIKELEENGLVEKNNYVLAWCDFVTAWIILEYDEYDKHEESIKLFKTAQEKFAGQGEEALRLRAVNGEASAYFQYGYFDKALEKYLEALELAEDLARDSLINIIICNIGNLMVELKQYEDAIRYFERSFSIWEKPSVDIAFQYCMISKAYRNLEEYQKSEELVLKALEISQRENLHYAHSYSLLELGILRYNQGQLAEAKNIFSEAQAYGLENNIVRIIAVGALYLGLIEKENCNFSLALDHLLPTLTLLKNIKARNHEYQALQALAGIYEVLADHEEAYLMLKNSTELKKQLFSEEMVNKVSIMKIKQARRENVIYKELYDKINAISQIGQIVTSTLDVDEVSQLVYSYLQKLMPADILMIGVLNEEKDSLNYSIKIVDGEVQKEETVGLKEGHFIEKSCLTNKRGLIVNDLSKYKKFIGKENKETILNEEMGSWICCPLSIRGKLVGILSVQAREKNMYSSHQIDVLNALAAYTAIALENSKLFSYINKMATIDFLTDIPNRRSVFAYGEKEFNSARRYEKPLSVIIADVDSFKKINDNYGHSAGDTLLKDLAQSFKDTLRETDYLGRIGGEEFLLILPDTDSQEAMNLASRLQGGAAGRDYVFAGLDVKVTASFGVARVIPEDEDIYKTVKRADQALYYAKELGGNRVEFASD